LEKEEQKSPNTSSSPEGQKSKANNTPPKQLNQTAQGNGSSFKNWERETDIITGASGEKKRKTTRKRSGEIKNNGSSETKNN